MVTTSIVTTRPTLAVLPPHTTAQGAPWSSVCDPGIRACVPGFTWNGLKRRAALASWHQLTGVPISAKTNTGIAVQMPAGRFPHKGAARTEVLTGPGITAHAALLGSCMTAWPRRGRCLPLRLPLASVRFGASRTGQGRHVARAAPCRRRVELSSVGFPTVERYGLSDPHVGLGFLTRGLQ
jgi:hypothetical protein